MSNQYKLIDTHVHLDDPKFDKDRDEVIKKALDAGLEKIITIGCYQPTKPFKTLIDLAEKYDCIYVSLGVHPHEAASANKEVLHEIKELAKHQKVIAIGEVGLDYHYEYTPRDIQKKVFVDYIQLARELNLPLSIHSREAQVDTLNILKAEGINDIGGVLHCFSGDYAMAKKCLDWGLYLSFTGVVTFPKASNIQDIVKKIPIEKMLIETDCPYLSPEPHRGKRNEPSYVVETAKKIAEIKGLSYEDVARITTLNAKELFSIETKSEDIKIAYPIRNSLYLNITNRCTNHCTFCAKFKSYTVKGHYLRLKEEPNFLEIIRAAGDNPNRYDEIVFCGFGEPLLRLDTVKEVGEFLKKQGCKIRIDTDGLANLVHGRNILPEITFADEISISMNAHDSDTYQRLIKTPFGNKAFPAVLSFIKESKKYIPKVTASAVAVPELDINACRRLADDIGVIFKLRKYDEVG